MPGPRGPELPSKMGLMEPGLTPLGGPSFLPHLSPRGLSVGGQVLWLPVSGWQNGAKSMTSVALEGGVSSWGWRFELR